MCVRMIIGIKRLIVCEHGMVDYGTCNTDDYHDDDDDFSSNLKALELSVSHSFQFLFLVNEIDFKRGRRAGGGRESS